MPEPKTFTEDIRRWTCDACGSPLAAEFSYLEGQVYVPVGILDNAESLKPSLHAHAEHELPWLHLADGLDRVTGSARDRLGCK